MTQKSVISYPTPPYQNPPIEPQFYQPKMYIISAITLGILTTITTSIPHDYVIGQLCRLLIPSKYGSRELNEKEAYVIAIPSDTQITLEIDSNGVDPFITSPTFIPFQQKTLPQILAIGDINMGKINNSGRINNGTFIPGSFINISPL